MHTNTAKQAQARKDFHPVMILLPDSLKHRIDAVAEEMGFASRTALIRLACDEFLRQRERKGNSV